jgi:hypothetical protein
MLVARAGHAQGVKATYGFAAGAAFPLQAAYVNIGYTGLAFVGFEPPGPVGARFEGAFNRFPVKTGDNVDAWSVTGNAIFKIPARPVHPYAILGIGYYTGKFVGSGSHFGTNIGFGARVPVAADVAIFGELRFHRTFEGHGIANQDYYLPLVFGVQL